MNVDLCTHQYRNTLARTHTHGHEPSESETIKCTNLNAVNCGKRRKSHTLGDYCGRKIWHCFPIA